MVGYPRILILTPFRNEDHSIPFYLDALRELEYPSELIDLYWLENDSSDETLKLLKEAEPTLTFHSVTLETVTIIGKTKKNPPGSYCKDVPYIPNLRYRSWSVIWNEYFLPWIQESNDDYVLIWYADVVPPPTVIKSFLKVFNEKTDAGWVGGANYRRYPLHKQLGGPIPRRRAWSKEVVEIKFVGHCWMCPREALSKTYFRNKLESIDGEIRDFHYSLTKDIKTQGLKVYYQPTVFLKHVSTDGKIYKKNFKLEDKIN